MNKAKILLLIGLAGLYFGILVINFISNFNLNTPETTLEKENTPARFIIVGECQIETGGKFNIDAVILRDISTGIEYLGYRHGSSGGITRLWGKEDE